MKKFYVTILGLVLTVGLFGQSSSPVPQNHFKKGLMPQGFVKGANAEKVSGSFYIDYEEYDISNQYDIESFVDFVNQNYNDTGSIWSAWVTFDTLVTTTDYNTWNFYSNTTDISSLTIDSIFAIMHHQNNSGQNDTIIVGIYPLGSDGRPSTQVQPLWSDTTITNTTLVGPSSPTGYPLAAFSWTPGITLSGIGNATKFAMRVTYMGSTLDTFALRFGWPNIGNQCGNLQVPEPILSETYNTAYYQINIANQVSIVYPNAQGQGYWYMDCNQSSSANWPDENIYQHWFMWSYVTVDDQNLGTGIEELNGVKLSQNVPNPANGTALINYELPSTSSVKFTVTDLSGRVVTSMDLGTKAAGKYNETLNTADYNSGIYFYTLEAGSTKLTRRMVVAH